MLDLNLPPNDEDVDLSIGQSQISEPFIGQTFCTFQEAFVMYESYAKQNGFVVRKDRSDRKNNRTVRRDIYCHRGGKKQLKSKHHRKRESIRCGCNAHMRITFKRSYEIFPEEWHITKFVKEHNHDLLSPEAMRFLPVNRTITPEDEKQILLYKEAGLKVRQIIRVMELQKQVKHGDLSFLEKDVHNLFAKVSRLHGASDAMDLIEYMENSRLQDKKFQYVYTLDAENRLENLFWCHPQSYEWYEKYGDVVVFDTTYKVNAYDMPCALFVGVNNYGKTVLFGSALLRNETTNTFRWLMKTFVTTMKKPSKTIITDQDKWMSEAIAIEMPTTKHSYCIWHITSKFSCWFTALLRTEYQHWCHDFYVLYRMNSVEEFEHNWFLIVKKYNLDNNKHVQGLYELRKSWVPAYLRSYFFGGMTSTQRSESINALIKRFVSSHTSLREFVKQVDLAVEEMRNKQIHDHMLATLRPTSMKTKSPLEKQAYEAFTPFAFRKFQEEFERASLYLIDRFDGKEFLIRYYEEGNHKCHSVYWDGYTASCSCKNFEFWGILCRHILRALIHKDCFILPHLYLPRRWCLDSLQNDNVVHDISMSSQDHSSLQPDKVLDRGKEILCPPRSKTKGRPKNNRRMKSGKELASKTRNKCFICRQIGHTKPTCPYKENIVIDGRISSKMSENMKNYSTCDESLNPVFTVKYQPSSSNVKDDDI